MAMVKLVTNREESMNQLSANSEVLSNTQEKASFHLRSVPVTPAADQASHTLRDTVALALKNYFAHLDGQPVTDIYEMVLSEIEPPLLEAVLKYTRNNQSKASILLGLNRGTLRKKLQTHGLL